MCIQALVKIATLCLPQILEIAKTSFQQLFEVMTGTSSSYNSTILV